MDRFLTIIRTRGDQNLTRSGQGTIGAKILFMRVNGIEICNQVFPENDLVFDDDC